MWMPQTFNFFIFVQEIFRNFGTDFNNFLFKDIKIKNPWVCQQQELLKDIQILQRGNATTQLRKY